jgi:hypothetical protein
LSHVPGSNVAFEIDGYDPSSRAGWQAVTPGFCPPRIVTSTPSLNSRRLSPGVSGATPPSSSSLAR